MSVQRALTICVLSVAAMLLRPAEAADRLRPTFHFLPPANWMNDTMGVWFQGKYHIFYLYNPDGPIWRQAKEWGHASSPDLVHWDHLSATLGPMPGGPEALCCQTGSVLVNDNIPTAFYTCAPGICMAMSNDNLRTWQRYKKNPVIAGPPPGMDVFGFRDPFVFKRDNKWYLLEGSGIKGKGGTVLVYQSEDLHSWKYLGPLVSEFGKEDQVWEVPEVFRLGTKDVLTYSPTKESRFTRYFAGSFDKGAFHPVSRGKIDLGGYFYAATSLEGPSNRRVMIAWVKEARSKDDVLKAGWSGILSVPRVLSMGSGDTVKSEPVPEIETLRIEVKSATNMKLLPGTAQPLAGVQGDALDIDAEFEPGSAKRFGVKVLASPDGQEETAIYYDRVTSRLMMDTSRSSLATSVTKELVGDGALSSNPKIIRLRILVDRSIVEAFTGDGTAITGRVYPTRPDSLNIRVFTDGGQALLRSIRVWKMKSIW